MIVDSHNHPGHVSGVDVFGRDVVAVAHAGRRGGHRAEEDRGGAPLKMETVTGPAKRLAMERIDVRLMHVLPAPHGTPCEGKEEPGRRFAPSCLWRPRRERYAQERKSTGDVHRRLRRVASAASSKMAGSMRHERGEPPADADDRLQSL